MIIVIFLWLLPLAVPQFGCSCREKFGKTECRAPCIYDEDDKECREQTSKECSSVKSQHLCYFPNCYWDGSKCTEFTRCPLTPTAGYKNNTLGFCMKYGCGLYSDGHFCQDPRRECSQNNNSDVDCNNSVVYSSLNPLKVTMCRWNVESYSCQEYHGCITENEDNCNKNKHCFWNQTWNSGVNESECVFKRCDKYTTQLECIERPFCNWFNSTEEEEGTCQHIDCLKIKTRDQCGKHSVACRWTGTYCNFCVHATLLGCWIALIALLI